MTSFPGWVIRSGCSAGIDYSEFLAAPDSSWSCLQPWALRQTAEVFRRECPAAATIIDATANVGCDAVNFCRMYPGARVTAVELAPQTAAILRQNAVGGPARYFARTGKLAALERAAGSPLPPITVIEADCLEYLSGGPAADFVYFDPPWCEPAAPVAVAAVAAAAVPARPERRPLELSGRPLGAAIGDTLRRNSPLVVAKLPPDYPVGQLTDDANERTETAVSVRRYEIRKPSGALAYVLVFIRL